MKHFKAELQPSMKADFICFSKSPLKMMKNGFYFTMKKLFSFLIYLGFCPNNVRHKKAKINLKIYDVVY